MAKRKAKLPPGYVQYVVFYPGHKPYTVALHEQYAIVDSVEQAVTNMLANKHTMVREGDVDAVMQRVAAGERVTSGVDG